MNRTVVQCVSSELLCIEGTDPIVGGGGGVGKVRYPFRRMRNEISHICHDLEREET